METTLPPKNLMQRYQRALFVGIGAGAFFYLFFSLYAELPKVIQALQDFHWMLIIPILGLSFLNYGIRYLRWEYYLENLSIVIPRNTSFSIFMAGLSMTITPGKAGELLKCVLLKDVARTPILRSAPVIFAERLTDLLALILLSGVGIGQFYQNQLNVIGTAGVFILGVILVIQWKSFVLRLLSLLHHVPILTTHVPRLEELYRSTAQLLTFKPLLVGVFLSAAAWFAECFGYYVVFTGHGVATSVLVCTFLYASSTILGVISPGGLGITDLSLGQGAQLLIPGLTPSLAVASAFIIRLCTLWFAVLIGSIALMRFKGALHTGDTPTGSG